MQEPLVDKEKTAKGVSREKESAPLFFGIGLCNRHGISAGLPIDVLSLLFLGEKIGTEKHVLIADTHATLNWFDTRRIETLADQYEERISRAISAFGFRGWKVLRAREVCQESTHQEIVARLHAIENRYVTLELADMEWFRTQRRVELKLGWALEGSANSSELEFDRLHREIFDCRGLEFVYLMPGRTFDPLKVRAAPYFCEDPTTRVLLEPGEDVARKIAHARVRFGDAGIKPYMNFLKALARLYDGVVGRTNEGREPIETRLQSMIERCA